MGGTASGHSHAVRGGPAITSNSAFTTNELLCPPEAATQGCYPRDMLWTLTPKPLIHCPHYYSFLLGPQPEWR